jgi:hypothetical protein
MQDWEKREGTNLDPAGELVTTQRWPQFQKDLLRWHSQLGLCWDRKLLRWAIYRRDLERRPIDMDSDGTHTTLHYMHPVYTLVFAIEWFTEDDHYMPIRHYREPGEWIFREFAQMHPAQFGLHDHEWFAKYTRDWGEEKYEKSLADAQRIARETVDEAMAGTSKTNPDWDKTHHAVPEIPA